MGGKLPATFVEGLLSGIGHPVIGPDHLAFLIAIGVVVGAGGLNLAFPVAFVVATVVGVAAHVGGVNLPAVEIMVALSVLLAGFLIASDRGLSLLGWGAFFAVAGVLHGYAFGESIYGAETSPVSAYLIGLVLIQSSLTICIALITRHVSTHVSHFGPRLAGAAILGVGFAVLVGQLIPSPI
jgi:urease accessory protein